MKILVIISGILLVKYTIVQLFALKSLHKIKGWANDKKNEGIPYLNKFELFGYNVTYEVLTHEIKLL